MCLPVTFGSSIYLCHDVVYLVEYHCRFLAIEAAALVVGIPDGQFMAAFQCFLLFGSWHNRICFPSLFLSIAPGRHPMRSEAPSGADGSWRGFLPDSFRPVRPGYIYPIKSIF
jgi:hypothetical protein